MDSVNSDVTEKMKTLKRKYDTLCNREADIITQLQHEESSSTKKRRTEVIYWLENVESTRNKVQNIELQVSRSELLRSSLEKKQLVDRVENLTVEVAEYMEQGLFPAGLMSDEHEKVALLTPKLVGQAFERNLEILWEHLRNDDALIIGVWGMRGVGKTTLAAHVHNRIQQQSDSFDHVYWITVSQNPNIRKMQDDIAKAIDFEIPFEDDEIKRARMLSRELMKRKRSVLILDDVWNDLCLERAGIATAVNGCKLLVTSRSLDVCKRLCCQKKIKVEFLSKEEAWYLFDKTLRHPNMTLCPQVLEVAKCVAQECEGHPLLIITSASLMREVNDVHDWRAFLQALKELEDVFVEERVFQILKFNYKRLNDPAVKECILYCALYPEDHIIERKELIQYFIDEGLTGKWRNMQAQLDKGDDILNKLVNFCLLDDVEIVSEVGLRGVKMHNLVRDMAIKIMGPRFMVKAGMQLEEIPEEQEWLKDVESVSLMDNEIKEIASGTSPRCPKLLTLLLSRNKSLKRIANSFFEYMPGLQVLNLSECEQIEELPNSISNLKSLIALVLLGCCKLLYVPSLAELTSLKRLDLKKSGIKVVPHGLKMLVNLTYLDLSDTQNLKVFPSGILPNLIRLEYLKFGLWGVKVRGEELVKLTKLSSFEGCTIFDGKVNGFKEYVMSRRKYEGPNCSYGFRLDDGNKYVKETYSSQLMSYQVKLQNWSISKRTEEDANVDVETLEVLLKDVQSLEIEKCKDARSLSDVRWLDNATLNLKRFCIRHCEGMEGLVSFSKTSSPASSAFFFSTLEILDLQYLKNLCILFTLEGARRSFFPPSQPEAAIGGRVFSSLKRFTIGKCHKIKKLFQPFFLPNLRNLEEIHVSECDGLEEIISGFASTLQEEEEDDDDDDEEESIGSSSRSRSRTRNDYSVFKCSHVLPKLRTLSLRYLPLLERICDGKLVYDNLQDIQVRDCPRLLWNTSSQSPFVEKWKSIVGTMFEN